MAGKQARFLADCGQDLDQGIDAEMPVLAHSDHCAEEGEVNKEPARQLFRDRDPRIESITQDHVAENQDHHHGQA